MDALHRWCPNLESLRMIGNPLTEGAVNVDIVLFTIKVHTTRH